MTDAAYRELQGKSGRGGGLVDSPDPRRSRAFPLAAAGEGDRVRIYGHTGGRRLEHRLLDLGVTVGAEVEIVARQPGGPVLLAAGTSRLAIGFGMAQKVLVVPASGTVG